MRLAIFGLVVAFAAGGTAYAEENARHYAPHHDEKANRSEAVENLGTRRPVPRDTESYKIYKKSENERARLTDPNSRQIYKPKYGMRSGTKTPGAQIYTQDRMGTLGTRSLRNWP